MLCVKEILAIIIFWPNMTLGPKMTFWEGQVRFEDLTLRWSNPNRFKKVLAILLLFALIS